MKTKFCNQCEEFKPENKFGVVKNQSAHICIDCHRDYKNKFAKQKYAKVGGRAVPEDQRVYRNIDRERAQGMKTCRNPDCRKTFPNTPEYWHKNKQSKDGLHYDCKLCRNKKKNGYYKDNRDIILPKMKKYNKEHVFSEKQIFVLNHCTHEWKKITDISNNIADVTIGALIRKGMIEWKPDSRCNIALNYLDGYIKLTEGNKQ